MSHHERCIRSDGDWICAGDCTHDAVEAGIAAVGRLAKLLEAARQHISQGHVSSCASVRFIPGCDVYIPCDCGFDLARECLKEVDR